MWYQGTRTVVLGSSLLLCPGYTPPVHPLLPLYATVTRTTTVTDDDTLGSSPPTQPGQRSFSLFSSLLPV